MKRIIYNSQACDQFEWAEIVKMAKHARLYNQAHDLSGMLLMSDRQFQQVLEGPAAEVDALYARIQQDPRHTQIELIESCEVNQRLFAKWQMKEVRTDRFPEKIQTHLTRRHDHDADNILVLTKNAAKALLLMQDIYELTATR